MRGRPKKEDSRENQYRVRLNNAEDEMLSYVSSSTGIAKSEIFRKALSDYFAKVQLQEYAADAQDEEDWEADRISLQRVVKCPYCGAQNRVDFTDECDVSSSERQMGAETLYEFDSDNFDCSSCDKRFHIFGYISEYPVGAYNAEEINISRLED